MIVLLVIGLVTGAVVPVPIVAAAPQRMSNRGTGKNECGYGVPPIRKSVGIEAGYRQDRRSHRSDAAVAPDRHFYAAVRWAAFDALSCPSSAHLEKKI
jgi:hypothetical protein